MLNYDKSLKIRIGCKIVFSFQLQEVEELIIEKWNNV